VLGAPFGADRRACAQRRRAAPQPAVRARITVHRLRPDLAPGHGETAATKSIAGAFSGTDLDATLRARGLDTLVVAGIMTHLAVDSTVPDAAVLGYKVLVASEGTAARDLPGAAGGQPVDHATLQPAALADRFADVATTREITALALE
jgi:nicotinamidase-related amidase